VAGLVNGRALDWPEDSFAGTRPMRYEGFAHQIRGRVARDAAEHFLCSRGVCESAIDDALLVLGELVSNACRHVLRPKLAWISIVVAVPPAGGVRIEIYDPSPKPPVLRSVRLDDESGYGLNIVNRAATCWGHDFPYPYRKRVWAYVHDPDVGATVPRLANPDADTADDELARSGHFLKL
jgi:hypothetical protein